MSIFKCYHQNINHLVLVKWNVSKKVRQQSEDLVVLIETRETHTSSDAQLDTKSFMKTLTRASDTSLTDTLANTLTVLHILSLKTMWTDTSFSLKPCRLIAQQHTLSLGVSLPRLRDVYYWLLRQRRTPRQATIDERHNKLDSRNTDRSRRSTTGYPISLSVSASYPSRQMKAWGGVWTSKRISLPLLKDSSMGWVKQD